jgi:hypothetical protein
MKKQFTKLLAVIFVLLLSSWNLIAQDVTFNGFTSSWTNATANAGLENECTLTTEGTTSKSTGYVSCSASPSYMVVTLTRATSTVISRVDIEVLANNTTTGKYGLCAFSANNTTFTNGATFLLPSNAAPITTSTYSYTAPTGAKYYKAGRTATGTVLGGATNTAGGATVRFYSIKVWLASSCTPGTAYNVGGTASILLGNSTNVTLDGSTSGINYQLYKGGIAEGSAVAGTGSALSWSVSPTATSTYTIKSVGDATTCESTMTGNAVITVTSSSPIINLTSTAGTNAQTPSVNTAITAITYSLAGGTATTAAVTWTGTADAATPPTGITVNFTFPTLTISGTPSVVGNYGYTATTDGTPAAVATGSINVSVYASGDYVSIATGNWDTPATWKKWTGSSFTSPAPEYPNLATSNVYVDGGFTVTVNTSSRSVKNLYIQNGSTLKSNSLVNTPVYTKVYGTLVQVDAGCTMGSTSSSLGDAANSLSIDYFGTGSNPTLTITGEGVMNLCRLRTNTAGTTVIIDKDLSLNYHGTKNYGNAAAFYAATGDANILTINAGKTLSFAPWACLMPSASSHTSGTLAQTININGTLTFMPGNAAPDTVAVSRIGWRPSNYLSCAITGKAYVINVGSTGTLNATEFYPNGTKADNTMGAGDVTTVSVASGGVINVSKIADLRNASQTITGEGTVNLLSGSEIKVGSASGLNAPILTTAVNYDPSTIYNFAGTVAQVTGSALPASVTNLTISNTAGVTLSQATAVGGTLTVNAGALLKTGGSVFTNNGIAAVNGTFQIDEGGWATGNDFVYGAASTLAFNNTSGLYGISSDAKYWPFAGGPKNVTVGTGGITLNAWRSVDGLFQTSGGVTIPGGEKLTINGQLQMNSGGYISSNSPEYGAASSLIYNAGAGGYTTGLEWPTLNAPFNVEIKNATPVTLSGTRTVAGTLTLTSGNAILGANDLTVGTAISGGSATSYIVTEGAGKITLPTTSSVATLIPIGASATSYDPVSVTPTTGTNFAAKVYTTLSGSPVYGVRYNTKEWNITPDVSSSTLIALTPSVINESIASPVIGHYVGIAYVNSSATMINGGTTYTGTFDTFSPFVTGANIDVTNLSIGSNSDISVYTVNKLLYVNGLKTGDIVNVYSVNGQKVAQRIASTNTLSTPLQKGAYVINVKTADEVKTIKTCVK